MKSSPKTVVCCLAVLGAGLVLGAWSRDGAAEANNPSKSWVTRLSTSNQEQRKVNQGNVDTSTDDANKKSVSTTTPVETGVIQETTPLPRFELLYNGDAVLDHKTGLVWEVSASNIQNTIELAKISCLNLKTGGHMGWRLPEAHELLRLADPTVTNADLRLPSGHPFTLPKYWSFKDDKGSTNTFWTSTIVPSVTYDPPSLPSVIYVSLSTLSSYAVEKPYTKPSSPPNRFVWCVSDTK